MEDSNSSKGIDDSNSKRRGMQFARIQDDAASDDTEDSTWVSFAPPALFCSTSSPWEGERRWPRQRRAASTIIEQGKGEEREW